MVGSSAAVVFILRRRRAHSDPRRWRHPGNRAAAAAAGRRGGRTMSRLQGIDFVRRRSFIELDARARAKALLDEGSDRELLGPFERIESPWLAQQGVTPQSDDGCVVMKGMIDGAAAVVVALEGAFQGGSMGEVSGTKMVAALDLAAKDCESGKQMS